MKKTICFAASLLLAALVVSCDGSTSSVVDTNTSITSTSLPAPVSTSVPSEINEEDIRLPESYIPQMPQSQLVFYDNIEDIPYGNFSIDDQGYILRDGEVYAGTPTHWRYQSPAIANDEFYIFVMYLYFEDAEESSGFQWVYGPWDKPLVFLLPYPGEDKLFVGVDGTLLLCEDGTAFDIELWDWIEIE